MVEQPILNERCWNDSNKSFLNEKIIKTRSCKSLKNAVVAVTDPNMFEDFNLINKNLLKKFYFVRWGTDIMGYVRCAEGLVDAVIERNIKIWDIAPMVPIIINAGGCITTWSGNPVGTDDTVCATGDRFLHKLVLNKLQKFI